MKKNKYMKMNESEVIEEENVNIKYVFILNCNESKFLFNSC